MRLHRDSGGALSLLCALRHPPRLSRGKRATEAGPFGWLLPDRPVQPCWLPLRAAWQAVR